jgi:hypothetical protein
MLEGGINPTPIATKLIKIPLIATNQIPKSPKGTLKFL